MNKFKVALSFFTLFAAGVAYADEPHAPEVRYTSLVTCTLDGASSTDLTAEKAMIQTLVKSGATFVDLPQAKRAQTDTTIRDLAHGVVSAELTAFDADVLIALDVRAFRDEGSTVLSESNVFRYQATIDASLISTDTGQALAVFSINKASIDTTAARAARNALQKAGDAIGQQILEQRTWRISASSCGYKRSRSPSSIGCAMRCSESEGFAPRKRCT